MEFLEPIEGKRILDATVGTGGHSEAFLKRLGSGALVALDQDSQALEIARTRLNGPGRQVSFIHSNFSNMKQAAENLGFYKFDGILMDLGVSKLQLTEPDRGFSFNRNEELDMRMDKRQHLTAKGIVNKYKEDSLRGLLQEYGEEPFARRIAAAIIHYRQKKRIETTLELAEIVKKAVPRKAWPKRIQPETRTFQAIRIAVNNELENLKQGLAQAVDLLDTGGKLLVISYHSLEDRIVKRYFKSCSQNSFKIITKKPIAPEKEEIFNNPQSRSAKLRVLERAS
ncbi:MAG: 16S rRNA (cytosine(1402)-N(4))-methyltransferase RsmH [Candidatus Eremiobacteraeota bacterium]|nr:16S rRNA (cytosine(1402)-N(4))-methyltransferase RsmH [Candidatus Eremiobacteraeota bacterium]